MPFGLRPRHLIALTLLRDHGAGTQQALAAAVRIDRTNLVGLLNELETDGLITRRLTEAEAALAAAEDDLLSALDTDDRETLYRLLHQATASHVHECHGHASSLACPAGERDHADDTCG
jgi:DNA-binding Lrp family transcriptional regulator